MSIYYFVRKYYSHIPTWVLKAVSAFYYVIPETKRYGQDYFTTKRLLERTEFLDRRQIDELVNQRFLHIINEAWEHVPYYREKYRQYGIHISHIKDIRDITKLPTIDKEELRQHQKEMISDKYQPSQLMYITTSGSTGNPVGFYQPKSMMMMEWAYVMHIWKRIGCSPSSIRLVLRGKKLLGDTHGKPYFYDPLRRELSCDIFQLNEENLESYCHAIEKYKPEYIHGYMSAIMILAKYVEVRGLRHHFRGILAISETVYPYQREYVERVFDTRVFSFYGHSERSVIAGECEKSSSYHVEPLYGYCELLDRDGLPAQDGEITGTSFLNDAMPLIRYRTGDISAWDVAAYCGCGRSHMRLVGVSGRWHQDMLVNSDGAYVSLTALNIHSDEFDHIVRYKLIQEQAGIVTMSIMPNREYVSADGERIKKILEEKVSGKIQFDIQLVEDLPIMENGKYRIVEQKLPASIV